jgi:hypothetical protein
VAAGIAAVAGAAVFVRVMVSLFTSERVVFGR